MEFSTLECSSNTNTAHSGCWLLVSQWRESISCCDPFAWTASQSNRWILCIKMALLAERLFQAAQWSWLEQPKRSNLQVYGDPLEHPQTESYWGNVNPIGERSCYDEGKRVAETLAFDYQREHGIEVSPAAKHHGIAPLWNASPKPGGTYNSIAASALPFGEGYCLCLLRHSGACI